MNRLKLSLALVFLLLLGLPTGVRADETDFFRKALDSVTLGEGVWAEQRQGDGPPATFFTDAKDPRTKEFLSQIL